MLNPLPPLALTLGLACCLGEPEHQAVTLADAHHLRYTGQYGAALDLYQQLAVRGDAEAAERAGFMLLQGPAAYGGQVARDPDRAYRLLVQAAYAGRAGAQAILHLTDAAD